MTNVPPPSSEPGKGANWLRRKLAPFVGRQPQGDVIAANVEHGARGVAVGKNIVQIGTLAVPVWPLFALLLVIAVGSGLWALSRRGPSRMPEGQFNVAVARFSQRSEQGRIEESDGARELGKAVYNALDGQRAIYRDTLGGAAGETVGIWHDGSTSWREQGAPVGLVLSDSDAISTAQRLNIDVLIYGTIADDRLALKFYVAPRAQIYGDANVLLSRQLGNSSMGGYQFGELLRLERVGVSYRTEGVTRRASALFWLVKGLEAQSAGLFDDAIARLNNAEQLLSARQDGREVIAFFKGEASYYAALAPELPAEDVEQKLATAEGYFNQSLALSNNTFVRAQIGLGSAAIARYNPPDGDDPVAPQLKHLDAGIAAYDTALQLARQSPEQASVEAAANLALASAYYYKGSLFFEKHDDAAAQPLLERAAELSSQSYAVAMKARHYRQVAEALMSWGSALFDLAQIAYEQADYARSRQIYIEAGTMFAECVAQNDISPGDELLAQYADECQAYQSDVAQALTNNFEGEQQ